MTIYATNAHLHEEDGLLFAHDDRDQLRKLARASEDLRRDLAGHGYFRAPHETLIDHRARALVTVQVTAGEDGADLPQGARLRVSSPEQQAHGDTIFVTLAPLTLAPHAVASVNAEAEDFGAVYNISPHALKMLEMPTTGITQVTNPAAAAGGTDHQLTRAVVYRAMELIYADLLRVRDDAFDHKRSIYARWYKEEVARLVAAGLAIDRDLDGVASSIEERRNHGFHRLLRG